VKDYDTGLRIVPDPSIVILKSSCSVAAVLHRKHYGNPNSFNQWCNPFRLLPQHMDSSHYLLHHSLLQYLPFPPVEEQCVPPSVSSKVLPAKLPDCDLHSLRLMALHLKRLMFITALTINPSTL